MHATRGSRAWFAALGVVSVATCLACSPAVEPPLDAAVAEDALTAADAVTPSDAPRPPCAPSDHVLLCGERLLIAHRGGGLLRPEETLIAFEHAVALGADVLELDVRSSADGAIVLMHDDTVDRTTDGSGAVHDLSLAELRALDAGYRFTTDGGATFPYRGRGVRVATLDEVLAAHPSAWLSIEIKQTEPDIVSDVLAVIDAAGASERVVVVAFSDAVVASLRAQRPSLVTGMSLGEIVAFTALSAAREPTYVPPSRIAQVPHGSVTAAMVARAERFGVRLHPWTVNDRETMEQLLGLGVHGIMTDDPALLAEVLERR